MHAFQTVVVEALTALEGELLLFAAVFFALGLIDELLVDAIYLWGRLTGRLHTPRIDTSGIEEMPLGGLAAVFIPTWREDPVIGPTLAHALSVWPQDDLRIYVGCYRNDPETMASIMAAARGDERVRVVVVGEDGPTCKAHCLNRLYAALCLDEARSGRPAHMVVLHDAEDMVDAAALPLLDIAVRDHAFVQLPVMALPASDSVWVASHYSDEFAESHAKGMVVRGMLGAAIPGAGVGCAIARAKLGELARAEGGAPFAQGALTEDYELGLKIAALGGRGKFLRVRRQGGELVATRACFPDTLVQSVRQKTRWTHGIALQGWDRLGWRGGVAQRWMTLRDRRGPLAAILLAIAYFLFPLALALHIAADMGVMERRALTPGLTILLAITFAGLVWRLLLRALFTAREYGLRQGLLAIPRVLVSNVIAIMSGRRALMAYVRNLRGSPVVWDKTEHRAHPVLIKAAELTT